MKFGFIKGKTKEQLKEILEHHLEHRERIEEDFKNGRAVHTKQECEAVIKKLQGVKL